MTKKIIPNNSKKIKHKTLTQERLKELLHYDPDTGFFTWKVDRGNNNVKGKMAGSKNFKSRIAIGIDDTLYLAHRLAFLYMEGYFPEYQIDHKDRNPRNNKWENLRHVSHQCNMRNKSVYKTNKSGVTGVCWNKRDKVWRSFIKSGANQKMKHLGNFKILKEAVQTRWDAEVQYNFPNCNTTSSAYLHLKENKCKT
jgi:hypothetical protein